VAADEPYRFRGFASPNYTQVPDEVFDELMSILSGSEFKVLCYIVRRTFGFRKDADTISLTQIIGGIKTRDGRQLDKGTGLSRDSVTKAIKSLEEMGVVLVHRRSSATKGFESSTYSLRYRVEEASQGIRTRDVRKPDRGWSGCRTSPSPEIGPTRDSRTTNSWARPFEASNGTHG
jgi:phage replication O-like protein O